MFGRKKPTDAGEQSKDKMAAGPVIVVVLMEPSEVPLEPLRAYLETRGLGGQAVSDLKLHDKNILMFKLQDAMFAIAAMPPMPLRDLEGPCRTAWLWPEGKLASRVLKHKSHLLLTMLGGAGDPISRRLIMTQLTATASRLPGVLGIYWPEGTLVHYPKLFVEFAKEMNTAAAPPLLLWVDFRVHVDDIGNSSLFTTGLRALGHMEIEIPEVEMKPGALRDWTQSIVQYLLDNGPVLLDGQTIGMTANHQLKICYTKSSYGHSGIVMRFES